MDRFLKMLLRRAYGIDDVAADELYNFALGARPSEPSISAMPFDLEPGTERPMSVPDHTIKTPYEGGRVCLLEEAAITGSTTCSIPVRNEEEDMSGIQVPEREMGNERRSAKRVEGKFILRVRASFAAFDRMVLSQRGGQRQSVRQAVNSQQGKEVWR